MVTVGLLPDVPYISQLRKALIMVSLEEVSA
jgi:hypothetical protein